MSVRRLLGDTGLFVCVCVCLSVKVKMLCTGRDTGTLRRLFPAVVSVLTVPSCQEDGCIQF